MVQNEHLLANLGFDTAENEPPEVLMTSGIDPPSPLGVELPKEYRSGYSLVAFGEGSPAMFFLTSSQNGFFLTSNFFLTFF